MAPVIRSRWVFPAAFLLATIVLSGGFLVDAVGVNVASIKSLKLSDNNLAFSQPTTFTAWGECRQAHVTGRELMLSGRYEEALPILEKGAQCSHDSWAWFDLGKTQYALGNREGAAQSWQHTKDGYYEAVRLAQVVAQEGSPEDVIRAWEFAAVVAPNQQTPYIQLARLVADTNPEQVEVFLQQAIKADPSAVPAYIELGRYYVQTGKPAEAQALYEQALTFDEGNISLLTLLAENAVLLGDTPAAISYWQEIAWRTAGRRANAYYQIGSLALQDRNFPSALAFYRQALEIEPENPSFMLGLANVYWEMGCRQEAKNLYEEIVLLAANKTVKDQAQARLGELAGMDIESTPCIENP